MIERRALGRIPINQLALVALDGIRGVHPATVRNISVAGARISASYYFFPTRFSYRLMAFAIILRAALSGKREPIAASPLSSVAMGAIGIVDRQRRCVTLFDRRSIPGQKLAEARRRIVVERQHEARFDTPRVVIGDIFVPIMVAHVAGTTRGSKRPCVRRSRFATLDQCRLAQPKLAKRAKAGGGGRTRTCEAMRRLIYSQLPLPLGTLPRSTAAQSGRTLPATEDGHGT